MQGSAAGSMAWAGSGGTGSDSRTGYGGFPAGATNWPDPSCDTITMSRPGLACDTWKPCGIPHSGTPVSRVWLAMHGPRRTPPLRRPRPGETHRLPGGRPRRRETRRHPVIDDAEPPGSPGTYLAWSSGCSGARALVPCQPRRRTRCSPRGFQDPLPALRSRRPSLAAAG